MPVVKEACSRRRTMSGSFSPAILRKYPRVSKSPNGANVTTWLRADRSPGVSPSRYGRDDRFVAKRSTIVRSRKIKQLSYADVLETHRILFEAVYPWAGQDRLT